MDKFATFIIKHKKMILIVFILITLICVVLQGFVKKNYDMIKYLPKEAQSTIALKILNEEFSELMPNTSVMINNISIIEALDYKKQLEKIPGIEQVIWLDDMVDIKKPLEFYDTKTTEGFYKNNNALFSITITKGNEKETCRNIRELIGENNQLSGEAQDTAIMQDKTSSEATGAMLILIPAILIILFLSTSSWIEPLLFIAAIGVSVLINMGTNVFFKDISFMTGSISPILQLAVSLDYAIYLLHSFTDNRKKYSDINIAMKESIKSSVLTVSASALTTLCGFVALAFMKFGIGADLGINLAKGIILSFISTMVFLPALTLLLYKYIDKTKHRQLMPDFKNINKVLSKISIPVTILVVLLIVPGFLGQGQTGFIYGSSNVVKDSQGGLDKIRINEEFGSSNVLVLLVPRGSPLMEKNLSEEILEIPHVKNVMSYANTVGTVIPPEYLGTEITKNFYSENFARLIIYTDTEDEGDVAFATVEKIQNAAKSYYGDKAYSLGQSANLLDMKNVIKVDNTLINIIAIVSIFFVLLLSFKSLTLPLILLITIETGIWINLSIPYFMGTPINFIGYLVLCTVQLGATVDYAILLTDRYLYKRKLMGKREAIHQALGETFRSILVSGATLSIAGFILFFTSTNPAAADIGLLLGRGTILSFLMVVCFLPAMLMIFDKAIAKTTLKSNFFKKISSENKEI